MKNLYSFLFLLIVSLACADHSIAQTSLPVEAYSKAIAQPNIQILDVRTIGEYNSGYLKNALQADWNNKEQFFDRTQHLDKSKPVYVYCLGGGRSNAAAIALREKGFTAINLDGGINAWKQAGKAVEGLKEDQKITESDYLKLTTEAKLVLIDFGAPWCPPCKKMEPVINNIRNTMGASILVNYVDGGQNTQLMTDYKVDAMPTFIIYKQGKEVWRKQGIVSQEEFNTVIKSFQ
jgi:rhodanese-related sulfurtransferase